MVAATIPAGLTVAAAREAVSAYQDRLGDSDPRELVELWRERQLCEEVLAMLGDEDFGIQDDDLVVDVITAGDQDIVNIIVENLEPTR